MAESRKKNVLEFKNIKDDLLKVLSLKLTEQFHNPSDYTLIDSFINQPIQNELAGNLIIGGPAIPMIALVHNKTGQLHFYALRALLPNIEL